MTSRGSPQPNVPGRGIVASYEPRFWALAAGIGVATGAVGAALMKLLVAVEHAAWSFTHGTLLEAARAAPAWQHIVVLVLAGLISGIGALVLLRLRGSGGGEISEALWLEGARLPLVSSIARGTQSIVTVGMGASLGREQGPQLAGAAMASWAATWGELPAWQRRLLVACGTGAGMAAVYNVPLGGALFAIEVLLGTLALPLVLPALVTSLIATAVAWLVLNDRPTYQVPGYSVTVSLIVWAALIGPAAGLVAVGWVRVIARVNRMRPRRRGRRFTAPLVVFAALGALSIPYPELLGNGSDVVQLAALGKLSLGLLAVLVVLKPLATAACLGSGSPGGLFTPTLTLGVLFGGVLGHLWALLFDGTPAGAYALVGGTGVLAAAMQGPLAAIVLFLELTRHTDALMVPILIAVTEATVVARLVRAPSIYSARLSVEPEAAAQTPDPVDGYGRDLLAHLETDADAERAGRASRPRG